jgi:gamma-glutamyltranspeptidase/glutathione hydrolase
VAALLGASLPARAAFVGSAEGAHVAVATDHAEATRAAIATMRAGGNAADGAIAAALAVGVVNPVSSGLGGGGFALVYTARDRRIVAIDFRETAPLHLNTEELLRRAHGFGKDESAAKRGVSVGVPGEPLGLERLSRMFAKRSLADDAAPAVALAEHGFLASRYLSEMAAFMKDRAAVSQELAALLVPGGTPLAFRATVVRAQLARTIAHFGAEGAKVFYAGNVGARVVRSAQAAGGNLEPADLAAYQVKERAPLVRTVDGFTVATMPAPSAGGLMVLEVVAMFGANQASPLRAMGFGSSAYLHTLAEAMRGAVADRVRFAGDPDGDPSVAASYERALDPVQLAARKGRIEANRTHPAPDFRTREHGTTHIVVADAEGNVVSLTTSVNAPFGARIVADGTGVILNDQLDDFSTTEDIAGFGVVGLGPNRPRGGMRAVSSMAPAIVLKDGVPVLAVGGSGGQRIGTGVTQATLARLVFGLDPSACVGSPRIHVNTSPELMVDSDVVEDVRAGLRGRGEQLKDDPWSRSSMNMIAWERTPLGVTLLAASDPRKGGMAAAQ